MKTFIGLLIAILMAITSYYVWKEPLSAVNLFILNFNLMVIYAAIGGVDGKDSGKKSAVSPP